MAPSPSLAGMLPNLKMMAVTMVIVVFSQKFLDSDNQAHVFSVRVIYVLSQFLCYGLVGYLYYKAKNNADPRVLTMKEDLGFGQEGEREVKVTVAEHDMRMSMKEGQRFLFATCFTLLLHLQWKFIAPLLIQAFSQTANLLQTPLVKVTLLGESSTGKLRRPWQDPGALGQQWTQWNDTINNALSGAPSGTRQSSKKAEKAAKKAAKRKSK